MAPARWREGWRLGTDDRSAGVGVSPPGTKSRAPGQPESRDRVPGGPPAARKCLLISPIAAGQGCESESVTPPSMFKL